MIDREKGGTADDRAPAAPFAIERSEKQAAKKIFFGERREQHRDHRVRNAQAGYFCHLLLRLADQLGAGRNMQQKRDVTAREKAEQDASGGAGEKRRLCLAEQKLPRSDACALLIDPGGGQNQMSRQETSRLAQKVRYTDGDNDQRRGRN